MKVYPPFLSCLRWAARTVITLLVVLLVVLVGARALKGGLAVLMDYPAVETIAAIVLFAAAFVLMLALVAYLGARAWAWSIDREGLKGRTYWGRRVSMRWEDITTITATPVEGIPALSIGASTTKAPLFAYLLGIDVDQVRSRLRLHAGPEHPLTRCFEP